MKTPIIILVCMIFSSFFLPAVFAERVATNYFSIEVPENWTYMTGSTGASSSLLGFEPNNEILLVPSNFSDSLHKFDGKNGTSFFEAMNETLAKGGSFIAFQQDTDYTLKNAPLSAYVKFRINSLNVTSKENVTMGNEKAVKATATVSWNPNYGFIIYLFLHDNDAYGAAYTFNKNENNNDKYLPQFEEMVKSFNFASSNVTIVSSNVTNG